MRTEFPERRTVSILLTILLFAAVCAIAFYARHVILLFVLSVFFAYLINPAVRFLERHSLIFRNLRGVAVTEVYIAILILIALGAYSFAPAVMRKTMQAVDAVPVILDGLSTGEIATEIGDKYGWDDQQKNRVKTVLLRHKDNFQGLQNWIDSSISQAAQIIGWMALIPILAIFLLRDGQGIVQTVIEMFLPQKHRQSARVLAGDLHLMLANYIQAQVRLCLFSLMFYLAVLLLFRFPHAVAVAFLGGTLEFIPVIGWMITATVITGIGIANDLHWVWMIALVLLWRVAQDYFNLPRALGHRLEIHPLTVIFAVLAGAEVGGIVGIFLSVPITASLLTLWRHRTVRAESPPAELATSENPRSLVESMRD